MRVERGEVERIARLARLHLTSEEVESLRAAMDVCVEHFAELEEVDASPLISAGSEDAVGPRSDEVSDDSLEIPLSVNAPDWRDDLFVVPRLPGLNGPSES